MLSSLQPPTRQNENCCLARLLRSGAVQSTRLQAHKRSTPKRHYFTSRSSPNWPQQGTFDTDQGAWNDLGQLLELRPRQAQVLSDLFAAADVTVNQHSHALSHQAWPLNGRRVIQRFSSPPTTPRQVDPQPLLLPFINHPKFAGAHDLKSDRGFPLRLQRAKRVQRCRPKVLGCIRSLAARRSQRTCAPGSQVTGSRTTAVGRFHQRYDAGPNGPSSCAASNRERKRLSLSDDRTIIGCGLRYSENASSVSASNAGPPHHNTVAFERTY